MRRLTASLVSVALAAAAPASADSDLVVLGPVADATVAGSLVEHVRHALDSVALTRRTNKAIDATCAADTTCLSTAGSELGARRVLAVSIASGKAGSVTIAVLLVDVAEKELVAKRDLAMTDRAVGAELSPALQKFLEQAPLERAKELFARGLEHYNLGEFADALALYKHAYRLKPLAAFLFNIAQCQRKLGQYKDSIAMYQSYLVGTPNAENRSMVESLIAESQAAFAEEQRLAEARAAEDAKRAAAEASRAAEERKAKEAEALAAVERRKTELARIEAEREREKTYDHHPARKWTYAGAGLGAATLIVGGAFGLVAHNAQASFDSIGCGDPSHVLPIGVLDTCRSDRERGRRDALIGNALMIGGGAVLAASTIVFVLDPGNISRPDETRARIAVSPTSIQMVVRW